MSTWKAVVTDKGDALLAKMTQGRVMEITHAELGAGQVDIDLLKQQTNVSSMKQTAAVEYAGYPADGVCSLPVTITNEGVSAGFSAWQIGVFANDPDEGKILFFIAQATDVATMIPSAALMPSYNTQIIFYVEYGSADSVSVTVNPANMVTQAGMENYVNSKVGNSKEEVTAHAADTNNPHGVTAAQVGLGSVPNVSTNNQTPTYTQASTLATLTSGEKLSVSMGKIMKAITDLISHISNKSNPHDVTATQVGLGNVPNVSTNNQTPTYTQASSLSTLTSGEKLSTSMGKIMKAITDLISHIANKSNPHGVTAAQVGLGNVNNTADNDKYVAYAQRAGSADKVQNTLTVRLNGGSTEGSNMWTFDGSTGRTVNITPDKIGLGNVDNTADSAKSVSYATSSGTADKTKNGLTIQLNGGQTEGTDKFTFNGSASKTLNITPDKIGAASKMTVDTSFDFTKNLDFSYNPGMKRYGNLRELRLSLANLTLANGKNTLFTMNEAKDKPGLAFYGTGFAYTGSGQCGTPVRMVVSNSDGAVQCYAPEAISNCSLVAGIVYLVND